jgi:hypothetical protein
MTTGRPFPIVADDADGAGSGCVSSPAGRNTSFSHDPLVMQRYRERAEPARRGGQLDAAPREEAMEHLKDKVALVTGAAVASDLASPVPAGWHEGRHFDVRSSARYGRRG